MEPVAILVVSVGFLGFGLLSRRIGGSLLTGPMLFAGFGFLVGSAALGLVPLKISNAAVHLLAEVTLILVLFADAASIDLVQLRRDHNLPVRTLLIGMPLTVALGTLAAVMLFGELTIWEAAMLAAILAPTDAALGQAVVTNRLVPVRIRQALNVESGLNDGVALPLVLVFGAVASMSHESADAAHWLTFGLTQVTLGPLAGIVVGYTGAKLIAFCHRSHWTTEESEGIIALALAFVAFASAEAVHGNGFIAAFVAGLTFGNTLRFKCKFLYEFAETEGQILILLTFFVFGSVMMPVALAHVTFVHVVFALLALTVIRMLPVTLALLGSGVRPVTSAFLGWFGPRGLASVLFVLLILEESEIAHKDELFTVTILTVMLSILLHGVTAGPAARWYGGMTSAMGECAENRPVAEEPFGEEGTRA